MADSEVGKLLFKVEADVAGLGAQLKSAEAQINDLTDSIQESSDKQATSVFKGVAAYDALKKTLGVVVGFVKDSVAESAEAARVMANVATNVKNAGFSYDDMKGKIEAASQAALQLGFDDEDAAESLSKFLLVTKDFSQAQALQTLAMDVARNKNVDLGTATKLVTLVTQGQTKALKEYGIELKDTASVADNLISLQNSVKGSAVAFADTAAGRMAILEQKWNNVKQEVGDKLTPALIKLVDVFEQNLPAIINDVEILANGLAKVLSWLARISGEQFLDYAAAQQKVIDQSKILNDEITKSIKGTSQYTKEQIKNAEQYGGISSLIVSATTKQALLNQVIADGGKVSSTTRQQLIQLGVPLESLQRGAQGFTKAGLAKALADTNTQLDGFNAIAKTSKADYDLITGAADDTTSALKGVGGASSASEQDAKDAAKAFSDMKDKLLDARDAADDLTKKLGTDLAGAFTDFQKSLKDTVKDSQSNLADIVVGAEKDIAAAQKQLQEEQAKSADDQSADSIKSLQDEIAEKQKILTSYSSFQTDVATEQARVQKNLDDALKAQATETDPQKKAGIDAQVEGLTAQVDAIKQFGDLDAQVAAARVAAGQDDFKNAEINTFAKLELAKNDYVQQTTLLRQKLAVAQQVEKEITDFYALQTSLRQANLDAFTASSIAQLSAIGDAAKSAMSALAALQSQQQRAGGTTAALPPATGAGLAAGGFSQGGEIVHGGEYVIPRSIVQSMPNLIGTLESARRGGGSTKNINAPVTINAAIGASVDARTVGREIAWEVSRL